MNKKRELVKARKLMLKHLFTIAFISNPIPKFMDLKPSTVKKMGYKNLVKLSVETSNYVSKLTKDHQVVFTTARQTGKSTIRTAIVDGVNHFLFIKNTFHRLGVYKNESPRLIRNRKRLIHRANTKSLKNHVRDFSYTVDVNLL